MESKLVLANFENIFVSLKDAKWICVDEYDNILTVSWRDFRGVDSTATLDNSGPGIKNIFRNLDKFQILNEFVFTTKYSAGLSVKNYEILTKPTSLKSIAFPHPSLLPAKFLNGIKILVDYDSYKWNTNMDFSWLPQSLETYRIGNEVDFNSKEEYEKAKRVFKDYGIKFTVEEPFY